MKKISWVLLFASILLCWGLFLPYVKAWEVGALELFAKNHMLYGLDITKGIPVFNLIDSNPNYYCSHPPLVPLLLSLSFKLFGINEWSARLVPIVFSIIGLFFFYLLIEHISNRKIALFSSIFMCFMPMFSYYSRIVNYEAVTLGLCLVFLYGFIKFIHTERRVFLILLISVTIIGALSDWPFYLLFPVFLIYVKGKNKGIKADIGLAILAFVIFIGVILMFNYVASASIKTQLNSFIYRCQYQEILTNFKFYKTLIKRSLLNFTPFGCLFLVLWLFRLLKQRSLFLEEANLFAGTLLMFGFALVFIAPQAAYIHDWSFQYLVPAVAFISALVVVKFKKRWRLIFISFFIISSLVYLTKLHTNKTLYGAYTAGRMIAKTSSPGDILYTNAVSPVCFYSDLETHFFAFGAREERDTETFIATKAPAFICIIKYAVEPRFDYEKIINFLWQKKYKIIYDKDGVVLWTYGYSLSDLG